MAEHRIAALLAESFELLAWAQPEAYTGMCERLEGLSVAVTVDAEHFAAVFSGGHAHVVPGYGGEGAHVSTRRETVLAVLDDAQSLTEAVLTDAVRVVGPLDTLLRLHEGLVLYVQGAVRCPGFAPLLRRLRQTDDSIA